MTKLLIRLFIKDYDNIENADVRIKYGILSGVVGIVLNTVLSVFKMVFGAITKSVSIVADGANNLFDAISSVISMIGFKISGKPADKEHPFGHGRVEYISALTLAFIIITMGIELIKSSIDRFNDSEAVIFSVPAVIVLVFSILGKIWLALFNKNIGKRINSVTVDAVIADSIGDIAATTCSLIALIASRFTDLPIDAVMGIIVALIILWAGIGIIRDTMGPLLGEPPDKEVVNELKNLVMSFEGIIGIHDLVLHSYGHGKIIGSLHAEVPGNIDMMQSHDTIDLIERSIKEKLGFEISIHMDPILIDDEKTNALKELVNQYIISEISEEVSIHDFRIVEGPSHTNIIFDAVLPYSAKISDNEFKESVDKALKEKDAKYFTVITIDKEFV